MTSDARTLRVAAAQMESRNCAVADNLERATGLAERAADAGARLVVFPEFMPTGYIFTEAIWDAAETADGPTMTWLTETSRRLGIWLGTCYLEARDEDFFNTFALTGPDGALAGTVRKQEPAAVEACFFKGVEGDHVIDTELGRVGVGICFENQLAFMSRLMFEQSVDIMLMPHSAPCPTPTPLVPQRFLDGYADVLEKLPTYYARALGVPVIYVNKSGRFKSTVPGMPFYPQDSSFPGLSTIADSDGSIVDRLGPEEGIAIGDVTMDPARKRKVAPGRRGRWALPVPLVARALPPAQAAGSIWYRLSGTRRRRAKAVSSGAQAPGRT
jgi:N-carbamoylputrescine amidase